MLHIELHFHSAMLCAARYPTLDEKRKAAPVILEIHGRLR